jgi:hypothetical protein
VAGGALKFWAIIFDAGVDIVLQIGKEIIQLPAPVWFHRAVFAARFLVENIITQDLFKVPDTGLVYLRRSAAHSPAFVPLAAADGIGAVKSAGGRPVLGALEKNLERLFVQILKLPECLGQVFTMPFCLIHDGYDSAIAGQCIYFPEIPLHLAALCIG